MTALRTFGARGPSRARGGLSVSSLPPLAAWLCWLLLAPTARADLDYRLKVQVVSEVDTNADRREGHDGKTDGASRYLLRGSLTHTPDPSNVIHVRLDLGGKMFFEQSAEDLFVSSGTLVLQHRLTSGLFARIHTTPACSTSVTSSGNAWAICRRK